MQTQGQINQHEQEGLYNFYQLPGRVTTLTMIKKPKFIQKYIYTQPKYFWLYKQLKSTQKQIRHRSRAQIQFYNLIDDAKVRILGDKNATIILIFDNSFTKQIKEKLYFDINATKILLVITYEKKTQNQVKTHFDQKKLQLNNQQDVVMWINQNSFQLRKQNREYFNFISLNKQVWDSNILVKIMISMIKQESDVKQIMKDFKELAHLILPPHEKTSLIKEFVKEYDSGALDYSLAIRWYSRQSFLYGFINRLLRICRDPTSIYILQPYFKDLFNGIRYLYKKQQQEGFQKNTSSNYRKFTCYRGGYISQIQVKYFKQHNGSYIQNLGFLSTTRDKRMVRNFCSNVIFQIQVDESQRDPQLDYGFASIQQHSHNSDEKQVLFNPLNNFKIIAFSKDQNKYMITLKYGQVSRIVACDGKNLKNQKQKDCQNFGKYQLLQSRRITFMGSVIIQKDQIFQGSSQYYEKFLQIANNSVDERQFFRIYYLKSTIFHNKGEYNQQMGQLIKCYELKKGKQNPNQIQALKNIMIHIGECFFRQGRYKQAIQWFEKPLKYKPSKQQYTNHYKILMNMVRCYRNQEMHHKEVQCLEKFLQIKRQFQQDNDWQYASALCLLGGSYRILGRYQLSIDCLQKSIKLTQKFLGTNHPIYGASLGNLGAIYCTLGNFQKAFQLLKKAEQIQRKTLPEDHPQYAITLCNLGFCSSGLGNEQKAIQCYEKTQKIQKKVIGKKHIDYTRTLHNMSLSYGKLGWFVKQFNILKQCQKIQKQVTGQNNIHYARTLVSLGSCYKQTGYFKQAIEYYEKSLKINKQKLGENHQSYFMALSNLADCLMTMKQFDKATKQYEKCQKILENSSYKNSRLQNPILDHLYCLYIIQGNTDKAQQCINKGSSFIFSIYSQMPVEITRQICMECINAIPTCFKQAKFIQLIQQYQKQKQQLKRFNNYYFDKCEGILTRIVDLYAGQFQLSMYDQLLSLIKFNYKQEAENALQIIIQQQKQLEVKQDPQFRNILDELSNLFKAMQGIWGSQRQKFEEKYKKCEEKLVKYLDKTSNKS